MPAGTRSRDYDPLRGAVLVYAFSPAGAQLLGTAAATTTVRLALPPPSAGYVFVEGAETGVSDTDLKKVRWSVKCGVP